MKAKLLGIVSLALTCLLVGGLLFVVLNSIDRPIKRRGRNVFGSPAKETLIEECTVPNTDAVVRLYEGNAGATIAFWWSVTYQESGLESERQFFYSYSIPAISEINCGEQTVEMITGFGTSEEDMRSISIEQIENELLDQPLGFYREEQLSPSLMFQPIRCLLQMTSVILLVVGLYLVIVYIVQRSNASPAD